MKKFEKYYLPAGILSLLLGMSLGWLNTGISVVHFIAGLLIGLSLPLNIYGIILQRKKMQQSIIKKG